MAKKKQIKVNKGLMTTAMWLAGVGALNWGLGLFQGFNLVEWIAQLGNVPVLATIVYGAVGFSGLLVLLKQMTLIK